MTNVWEYGILFVDEENTMKITIKLIKEILSMDNPTDQDYNVLMVWSKENPTHYLYDKVFDCVFTHLKQQSRAEKVENPTRCFSSSPLVCLALFKGGVL